MSALLLAALALAASGCDGPREVQVPLGSEALAGIYWEPRHRMSPAVLLLPMLGHGKEEWLPLATRLRAEGYGVLALDLREGGRTDRERLLADARAGFSFLREQKKVDAARIGVAGASLGANTALNFAAAEPMVRVAVLLSPGLNHLGVTTEPALRDFGARPLLLAGAEEDLSSAGAVRRLAELAQGDTVVKLYAGGAHGTDLLTAVPPAVEDVLAFLQAHL
ncbi:MAG: alpha/beta hydrolase [Candidatus Acidiferrales bacterium]